MRAKSVPMAVFPYWRELQNAPPVRSHRISYFQHMAYGFSEQRVLKKNQQGGEYLVVLRQMKDRPILVVTAQGADGQCASRAYAQIQDVESARLDHIFADVAGKLSVNYLEVHGVDVASGRKLLERLEP